MWIVIMLKKERCKKTTYFELNFKSSKRFIQLFLFKSFNFCVQIFRHDFSEATENSLKHSIMYENVLFLEIFKNLKWSDQIAG